jgi:excisionase family DNA binding protein
MNKYPEIPKAILAMSVAGLEEYFPGLSPLELVQALSEQRARGTSPPRPEPEQFLTIKEVARLLQISQRAVYLRVAEKGGGLQISRFGRSSRISRSCYESYCKSSMDGGQG